MTRWVPGSRVAGIYHLGRSPAEASSSTWSAAGRVEADTATGFIVTAVEGLAVEHRRVIREKTRDALARL